jgi:hypothetical protein
LSPEKWSRFNLDQQILMIANEMNRAGKLYKLEEGEHLNNCYERVLRLTDLTIRVNSKNTLRRELLRWRDLIAGLYISTAREREDHEAAFKCLLLFTPEASKQRPHVLEQRI